jgi:hypothetical protein
LCSPPGSHCRSHDDFRRARDRSHDHEHPRHISPVVECPVVECPVFQPAHPRRPLHSTAYFDAVHSRDSLNATRFGHFHDDNTTDTTDGDATNERAIRYRGLRRPMVANLARQPRGRQRQPRRLASGAG